MPELGPVSAVRRMGFAPPATGSPSLWFEVRRRGGSRDGSQDESSIWCSGDARPRSAPSTRARARWWRWRAGSPRSGTSLEPALGHEDSVVVRDDRGCYRRSAVVGGLCVAARGEAESLTHLSRLSPEGVQRRLDA